MLVLNRSAIVVKPKEPFLDWLHAADPSSRDLTLLDLVREPTIYLRRVGALNKAPSKRHLT
jgi:hypothetical protein